MLISVECYSQDAKSYLINYIDKKQYIYFTKDSIITNGYDISLKKSFENNLGVTIKTKSKNIQFKNNTSVDVDNDGYEKYEYLYFIKNHNKHVVKFKYFEGDYYLLIDDKNAKIDTLDSKPIIVKNYLLTIYQDMEDADQFSTLKFYNFNSENNLKLINTKKEKWVLKKTTILKNDKLIIFVTSLPGEKEKYGLIQFKN